MTIRCDIIIDNETWHDEWNAGRALARDMLQYLRNQLAAHGADLGDISGIGVFRGPGSYTGLRIGLTVLNTIAFDRHIPIVGETGDNWKNSVIQRLVDRESDTIVLPEYGGEAHITKPRK